MREIKHVSVIGGGIMGSGIAALFANNGVACTIFDLSPEIAQSSLDRLNDPKAKLPQLYTPRNARLIAADTTEHLDLIASSDWIIEVVPEVMKIKRDVFAKIDRYRKPGSIVTTNTSGLSIEGIASGLSDDLVSNFMGTHFFNPVRYLPLVEIIPHEATDPDAIEFVWDLFEDYGKKLVIGKDTPNFIANRIGIFMMAKVISLMEKYGLDLETVDMLTGSPIGNPKTATFRLNDMVGIDTFVHASMNCFENCPNDPKSGLFKPPAFVIEMVKRNLIGDKVGAGFYKKQKDDGKTDILVLDLHDFKYKPAGKPKSDVVKAAKSCDNAADRIKIMMTYSKDALESKFVAELLLDSAAYAIGLVGEIADDPATIDNALKWGFAKEVGPIEILDIFGLDRSAALMESFRIPLPETMKRAMEYTDHLYRTNGPVRSYFDLECADFDPILDRKTENDLELFGEEPDCLFENVGASLWDIGDEVLLCKLDNKLVPGMNPLDDFVLAMLDRARNLISRGDYRGLVIGGSGKNFCVGAQLQMILELSKAKKFKTIETVTAKLQDITLFLRHAPYPVVIAGHGMALGGGMEITLSGQKRVVHAEFYGGLVEVGVGLIPSGGGCLLLLEQCIETMASRNPGAMPPISAAFDLIGFGKVSSSADNAIDLGLLTCDDIIVKNRDDLLVRAKNEVLTMIDDFKPIPMVDLLLPGEAGYLVLDEAIEGMHRAGSISEHAARIAKIQAYVLCGGKNASLGSTVSPEDILALEREGFLKLCAEKKTQERIAYMLKNGKPLFN